MSFWYLGKLSRYYFHRCHFDVLYVINMPNYNGTGERREKKKHNNWLFIDWLFTWTFALKNCTISNWQQNQFAVDFFSGHGSIFGQKQGRANSIARKLFFFASVFWVSQSLSQQFLVEHFLHWLALFDKLFFYVIARLSHFIKIEKERGREWKASRVRRQNAYNVHSHLVVVQFYMHYTHTHRERERQCDEKMTPFCFENTHIKIWKENDGKFFFRARHFASNGFVSIKIAVNFIFAIFFIFIKMIQSIEINRQRRKKNWLPKICRHWIGEMKKLRPKNFHEKLGERLAGFPAQIKIITINVSMLDVKQDHISMTSFKCQ